MKKTLGIIISVIIAVSAFCTPAAAAKSASELPVVIVSGYASDQLYLNYGEENQEKIWSFPVSAALKQSADDLPNLTVSLFKMFGGDFKTIGKTIAGGGEVILEEMYCNPDGSSKYPLKTYPNDPAKSNYEYLLNNTDGENITETELVTSMAAKTGADNVFIFQYDFRMGGIDITADLNDYINDVLKYTGEDRVNLFGLSYGGFLVGVYLSLYGLQGDVHNAVMSVPALGGTSFAGRFLTGNVDLPLSSLISFAETAIGGESDLAPLFKNADTANLNELASAFLTEIGELPLYWGSMWDLMTPEDYNSLKGVLLDSTKSAELIRKSDIIHNVVMQNYSKSFEACRRCGVNISILCNYGTSTAFGGDVLGDVLLDAEKVSGAKCAKLGERFENGYTPVCTSCSDKTHNHVSPSLEIDASCAYLPENTWFFNGQYHGMYAFDKTSFALVNKLMTTDDEITVHSCEEYPQFIDSDNSYLGVSARFDKSVQGYLGDADTKLIITNLSDDKPVVLTGVKCEGIDLDFEMPANRLLKPGESVSLSFSGSIPKLDRQYFSINVQFIKPALGLIANSRTVDFSVMNSK